MSHVRLEDALILVSRLQEGGGDVRFLFRRDAAVQEEIRVYLDDLSWMVNRPLINPSEETEAASKAHLLSAVRGQSPRRRRDIFAALPRAVGAAATVGLVLGGALTAHATTSGLPPVNAVFRDLDLPFTHSRDAAPSMQADEALSIEAVEESDSQGLPGD